MATSRTGTTQWLRIAKHAKKQAQRDGITNCKYCRVILDYEQGLKPNSAEADHVEAYSHTGSNDGEIQIICRRCNQSKGNRPAPKKRVVLENKPLKTSRRW